jgi:hypothetical protein
MILLSMAILCFRPSTVRTRGYVRKISGTFLRSASSMSSWEWSWSRTRPRFASRATCDGRLHKASLKPSGCKGIELVKFPSPHTDMRISGTSGALSASISIFDAIEGP